ncbi:MAG: AraC family transcriptional regulator [Thalassobius sp.]|nr:AraC family transcriptional regulator [Thalassovita sp.]|tara:strand:- start:139 stop:519 length:381 start_codon:yes stop_codon:yes gene_type:complete
MTFYANTVKKLSEQLYAKEYLTTYIIRAKHLMDNHFGQELNLDAIAEEACLSKFHFIRMFKKYYGKTPNQYLREVRIKQAKSMLSEGIPVTAVCFAVGFNSLSTFSAFYKSYTGNTPSVQQKSNFK